MSSEWNPTVNGIYVRGVERGHEKAFVMAASKNNDDDDDDDDDINNYENINDDNNNNKKHTATTKLWLYYHDLGVDGYRWYIGVNIFQDHALAFVDSWSTDPCAASITTTTTTTTTTAAAIGQHRTTTATTTTATALQENNNNNNHTTTASSSSSSSSLYSREGNLPWKIYKDDEWKIDPTFQLKCYGYDLGGIDACSSTRLKQGNNNNNTATVPCIDLLGSGRYSEKEEPVKMPQIMLGTAYISALHGAGAANSEVIESPPAIALALDLGYQGLDLGSQIHPAYANERLVGQLLTTTNGNNDDNNIIRRQSVFLTTKLSPNEHGYDSTLRAAQRSLRLLRTDTIDLFLIHHPNCLMTDHCEGDWIESWKALERLLSLGAVRAIGVSNFNYDLLKRLLVGNPERGISATTSSIARAPISLLQNRADPLVQEDSRVLQLCELYGINYQAFSVLGRQHVVGPWTEYWKAPHPILANPDVIDIANRLSSKNEEEEAKIITPAQVVLRWALQKGWTVVPKTSKADRLESNRQVFHFQLSKSDMAVLDNLQAPLPRSKVDEEL